MAVARTAAALGLWYLGLAGSATAQTDYRNLDDERPVVTEDAYPIERHAFELLLAYRASGERELDGKVEHTLPMELAYGALDNTQLGVRTPFVGAGRAAGEGTGWGLGGLDMFALYNFNTDDLSLPALSLRTDVHLPVGGLAGSAARVGVKAIVTRAWGRFRVHANVVRSFGGEQDFGRADPLPRWRYGMAVDRTFFRQSLLLVGEVTAERAVAGAPTEVDAAAGVRWQWMPTLVLDVGVAHRLREDIGPDYAASIGLSHAFALGWLMPVRAR